MQTAIKNVVINAIETCLVQTSLVQKAKSLSCAFLEFLHFPILNRVGGTGLSACRLQAILHTVITKRAFACCMRALLVTRNDSEWTGNHTVAAAIADVLLHVHRVKFRANNRAGWASFMAGCMRTVFAYITAHEPAVSIEKGQGCTRWRHGDGAIAFGNLHIDER